MRDIVNNFRKETLNLPALHTRQAAFLMIDERVPYTYCWSPSLVPKPNDWADHINVSGFFFLKHDATADAKQPDDLLKFLGLNHSKKDEKLSPPIYIGFGSITGHDSVRLLQVVLEALDQTGYRALLSGLAKDDDELPDTVFKIGSVPHDWLFQHGKYNMMITNICFSVIFLSSICCMSSWWSRYDCRWSSCWQTDYYCSFLWRSIFLG
jgi:UDP:flavonoid glycosyltransferase YjiC (YdhE family)